MANAWERVASSFKFSTRSAVRPPLTAPYHLSTPSANTHLHLAQLPKRRSLTTNQSGIVGSGRVINHKTLSDIIYSHVNHRIVRFLRHGNWRVYGFGWRVGGVAQLTFTKEGISLQLLANYPYPYLRHPWKVWLNIEI